MDYLLQSYSPDVFWADMIAWVRGTIPENVIQIRQKTEEL